MLECTIQRVPVDRTRPLRRAVLRPHLPADDPYILDDDDLPTTAAYAAVTPDDRILSVGRISVEPPPFDLGDRTRLLNGADAATRGHEAADTLSWRVRGMATSPDARNLGLGTRVLDSLLQHVAANGGGLVWCKARLPARRLYERARMEPWGDVWDEPQIGAHVLMWEFVLSA